MFQAKCVSLHMDYVNIILISAAIQTKDLEFHVADSLDAMEPVDWLGSDPALFVYRPNLPSAQREVFSRDVPMRGRYVRVRMRKDDDSGWFCFAELEVYGMLQNFLTCC